MWYVLKMENRYFSPSPSFLSLPFPSLLLFLPLSLFYFFLLFSVLGIKPRTLHTLRKCSTTEPDALQPTYGISFWDGKNVLE
jgi:hypothetical protein